MGNRAFIKFQGEGTGIYLHWNGGRDSVEPFLEYCRLKGYRPDGYGVARMCQVIGNFFGGGLSLGVESTKGMSTADLSAGDNGVYIIKNWKIIGRYPRDVREQHEYDPIEFLLSIDEKQPESEKLGEAHIRENAFPERKGELDKPGEAPEAQDR